MNKTQLDKTLGTIKNYVNGNYLAKSGGTMTGSIEMGANNISFTNSDTGDIVFNEGATQVARLWQSTTGLLLAAGSSTNPMGAGVLNIPRNSNAITIGGNKIYHAGNKPTDIAIKGTNTITSTTNDTTTKWGEQGNSVHWYTTGGKITNQPSQWGYLLNIGAPGEVHQIWMEQAAGNLLHRGGNAQGWGTTWKTLVDSSNYASFITPSGIGAAAANHGNHVPSQCGTVSNWNDALHNGWYMASGAANQPAGDSSTWYMGQVLCHNTNYVIQILHQFASNGGDSSKTPIFIRKKFNGSWGSWTSNFAINITGSSTGLQTSSFKPMGAGSSTQPVYFSNGIPVAGKSYFAKSTVGDIGWEREDSHAPVTVSAIAFWNGAYRGSSSNLAYCNQGAFGNIVTKNQGDYAPASHNHTELTGEVKINNANGTFNDAWNGQECALKVGGHMAIGGTTLSSGEYRSYSANAFRAVQGDYGFFIRNDGSHTYFMLTNPGDPYGNWNNFRPITIVNSTGEALIGGTVDKWNGFRMRYGNHTGGADGYITFAW